MAEKEVDARGLACPQPVVLTRKAMLENGIDRIRVVVDRDVPAENIQRLARSQGWDLQLERQGDEIHLALRRGEASQDTVVENAKAVKTANAAVPNVAVFITSRLFGEGDEKLGEILMNAFVKTLKELEPRPSEVIFANSGVRLTTQGSDLVEDLRALEEDGVAISSCGTCLDYYDLLDALEVGTTSNMYDIATSLFQADRVIRP